MNAPQQGGWPYGEDGMADVDRLERCVEGGLELSGTLRVDVERPEMDRFFRPLETGAMT